MLVKKYITLVCSLFTFLSLLSPLSAQYTDWEIWHHGEYAYSIVPDGPNIQIGTNGGLITLDTVSAQTQQFNSINSNNLYARARTVTLDRSGGIWKSNNYSLSHFMNNNWTQYDTNSFGLPQFTLFRDVAVDSSGQAWVATSTGLIQNAGGAFTVYNASNSPITNEFFESLVVDSRDQSIWAAGYYFSGGMQLGRVLHFDGTSWTVYDSTTVPLFNGFIHEIDQHPITGDIWALTSKALHQFDGTNWISHPTNIPQLPDSVYREMAMDAQGNLYLGSINGALAQFDGTTWTAWNPNNSDLIRDWVSAIYPADPNRIWISQGSTNLALYNAQGQIIRAYDLGNSPIQTSYLNSIDLDPQGRKLFGSAFGLQRFDDALNSWELFDHSNSPLDSGRVTLEDIGKNGQIWTRSGDTYHQFDGVNSWISYPITSFPDSNHLSLDFISDDSAGFWVSNFGRTQSPFQGNTSHFDGTTWTTYDTSNSPIPGNWAFQIELNDSGALWFATESGVGYLFNGNWTIYTTQNGLSNAYCTGIQDDNQGNVWVLHDDTGASRLAGGQWTFFPDSVIGNLANIGGFIEVDALGEVWIGSDYQDFTYHFDGSSWDEFGISNTGLHGQIKGLVKDSVGNTWFATSYGLSAWRAGGVLLNREEDWAVEIGTSDSFIVFPNPFDEALTVEMDQIGAGAIKVCWIDMQGRVLRREEVAVWCKRLTFKRGNLPAGPMILVIDYGGQRFTKRVIAE